MRRILLVLVMAALLVAALTITSATAFAGETGPCRFQHVGNPAGKNGEHFEAIEDTAPGQIKNCPT